jgi:predicted O-linked N-acetylglucosamine transferase (SPINDLY family)
MSGDDAVRAALGRALERQRAGDLAGAAAALRTVLGAAPEHPVALHQLALIALQQGDAAAAVPLLRRAAAGDPDNAGLQFNLGLALRATDALDDAAASYARAIALKPGFADALLNLGNLQRQRGEPAAALANYERAIAAAPRHAGAHNNMGSALQDLGRWADAADAHRRALALNPEHPGAHYNLGNALIELRQSGAAVASLRRATELDPSYRQAFLKLAELLERRRELAPALAAYERALALDPDDATALDFVVHLRRLLCAWDGLPALQARLLAAVDAGARVRPFSLLSLASTPEQQRRCARRWVAELPDMPALWRAAPAADGRIRVGYLSTDFREHPIATLIMALLEQHDRARFRIAGYSIGPVQDGPRRRRIVAACEDFIDLYGESDAAVAARIAADGVDILVDLCGYTGGSRPAIAARRPAPVQVNWLCYTGTMGARFIDYIVADPVIAPPGAATAFDEVLVRLPESYQSNDPTRPVAPERPARAACGLPDDGVVLCCFNGTYKITPEIFAIWMRVLAGQPRAVLWLLEHEAASTANLRAAAAAHGVDPARLVFAPSVEHATHMARQPLADLFLDTTPYGAHTTGSDALWAGVPLLACPGATFASRVGASMLQALELPELIAPSLAAYEALAGALADDPARLAALRARVAAARARAPFFDAARFARHLEYAFEHMAARQRAGAAPAPFDVPALPR